MHAEEVKNKHFDAFLQNKSIKDKKSFFESFCKARLITENETNKKILNALSVVKEVFQAFGSLVKKPVKLTEGSKYELCQSLYLLQLQNPHDINLTKQH